MRNKDKKLLDALGERYTTIEHDGGYCLYDKERPAKRSQSKYTGKFYIASDKKQYAFRDNYYPDVESLVSAMDAYNATLPFDIDIYNPLFRKHVGIEMALHDYLGSLGFEWEMDRHETKFVLKDCCGQHICELSIHVKEDTTEGVITRHILIPGNFDVRTTESSFSDLDGAIASVNTILATYVVYVNAMVVNMLSKITSSRSTFLLDKHYSLKKVEVFAEDARAKMIEVLEKELEELKKGM